MLPSEAAFLALPVRPCCRADPHIRCPQRDYAAGRKQIVARPERFCCRAKAHFRRFQLVYDAAVRSCIPRASSEAMLPGGGAFAVLPARRCYCAKLHFSCFQRGYAAVRIRNSGTPGTIPRRFLDDFASKYLRHISKHVRNPGTGASREVRQAVRRKPTKRTKTALRRGCDRGTKRPADLQQPNVYLEPKWLR